MAETFCSCSHRASVEDTTLVTRHQTRRGGRDSCIPARLFSSPSVPQWLAQLVQQPNLTRTTPSIPPRLLARAATKSASVLPTLTAWNNQQRSSSVPRKVRIHQMLLQNTPISKHQPKLRAQAMCLSTLETRKRYYSSLSRRSRISSARSELLIFSLVALTPRVCSTACSHCLLKLRRQRRLNLHQHPLPLHLRRRSASAPSSETLPNILYAFSR